MYVCIYIHVYTHVCMNSGGQPLAGPLDVCRQTLQRDGLKGFYRGITPNMLKVLFSGSI